MKIRNLVFAASVALVAPVFAATAMGATETAGTPAAVTAKPPASASAANSQQDKMKTCQAGATTQGLKGPERQKFVSGCLKAKPASTLTPQQEKMKSCSADAKAKALKGDARKAFMSDCLKAH